MFYISRQLFQTIRTYWLFMYWFMWLLGCGAWGKTPWLIQHRRLGRNLPIMRSAQIPLAFPVTAVHCILDWLCTHYATQAGLVLEMLLYQHPEYQDDSCPPSHHARLPVTLGREAAWHFVKKRGFFVLFCFVFLCYFYCVVWEFAVRCYEIHRIIAQLLQESKLRCLWFHI